MTEKLVHKELSYQIIGILFDVYNQLGPGYQEKYYQRAVALALRKSGLKFREQVMVPLHFSGEPIGRYFVDFVIEDKIVLEIKAQKQFYKRDVKQILAYLKATKFPLGILANLSKDGVSFKRILRGNSR